MEKVSQKYTCQKGYNIGIDILRIWMCFEVVVDHFKNWGGTARLIFQDF